MRKALITGVTGFAGSHLADYLLTRNDCEIHGIWRWRSRTENIEHLKPGQMALHESLQAQRRVELGPFGAQHRDGIALFADFGAQPQHALDAGRRLHLDAIDIGGRENQCADHEEMDDPQGSASPHHVGQPRP